MQTIFNKMISFDDFEFISEAKAKKISGTKNIKKCIVFTDVRKSSELWSSSGAAMFNAIMKHESIISDISEKYDGEIVKSIGDAYMISFNALEDGVKFAIDIQSSKPIKVGNAGKIEVRVGICFGDVYEHKTERQGKMLLDYFGNTVNTASRLESKVSDVGGFAFGFTSSIPKDEKESILSIIDEKCGSCDEINYGEDKSASNSRKRSGRLLNDTQDYVYRSISNLNGVDELFVYSVKDVK